KGYVRGDDELTRRHSGELAELVIEMGLIKVSAIVRGLSKTCVGALVHAARCPNKSVHAQKFFRAYTYCVPESSHELATAQAERRCKFCHGNRFGGFLNELNAPFDCIVGAAFFVQPLV